MTGRSIFDADMAIPVVPVRPRPDGMALPEDALAEAMAREAAKADHMRARGWMVNTALRGASHSDGMPGNIAPGTVTAMVWRFLKANGPSRRDEVADGIGVHLLTINNALQRLILMRCIYRIGRGGPQCQFTTEAPV